MVLVRDATAEDAAGAVDLLRHSIMALCAADHGHDPDTLNAWLANKSPETFCRWLGDGDRYVIVAVVGDAIAGVGMLHRRGEICLCYVAPGMQRRGVGHALLRAMEECANQWGLSGLHLGSSASARPFYEAHGYMATGGPQVGFGVSKVYPYAKKFTRQS